MTGRMLVVWCPDWPLTAAGVPPTQPAVVLAAGRVVVCSAAARAAGVRTGLRRREAQSRCPELVVLAADARRDARVFTAVTNAAVDLVPTLEVVRPGLLALAVRGPARAFGGEQQVALRLGRAVDRAVRRAVAGPLAGGSAPGDGEAAAGEGVPDSSALSGDAPELASAVPGCRIGIADSRFAAMLAARRASTSPAVGVVPVGGDPSFLAALPITALTQGTSLMTGSVPGTGPDADATADLVELLARLGIRTLGDLAALPHTSVADRFGLIGARAHLLACGRDDRRVAPVRLPPDWSVRVELEEPAAQVETVAFAARGPAEELVTGLAAQGLRCTLVAVEAETEHAERLTRRWRADDGFTPTLLVDRVRWQLDGWLTGSAGEPAPTAGVILLRLDPVEVVAGGRQTALLEETAAPTPPVARLVTRLQGMLGHDAVLVGVPAGGRDPATWVVGVPWGEHEAGATGPASRSGPRRAGTAAGAASALPWPGRLPAPAPATVPAHPLPAEVVDGAGETVGVSGRGAVTGPPARVRIGTAGWQEVAGWAGPWPADERWWDQIGRRRARMQIAVTDGAAYLVALERGCWQVEAVYD